MNLARSRTVRSLRANPKPWLKVKGTMSAVVATLLEVHWNPAGPALWVDNDGEIFDLDTCDRDRLVEYALRGALSENI